MARRTYRRRRRSSLSLTKRARSIMMGFIYVALAGALIGGVTLLVSTIGSVTVTINGNTYDFTIFLMGGSALFSILLFAKAARYFGIRL